MTDGGDFDLCECINGHEAAMRRLLGILRQSQAFCSDSSCVDNLSPAPPADTNPMTLTYMIFAALMFAVIGIIFQARGGRNTDGKPSRGFSRVCVALDLLLRCFVTFESIGLCYVVYDTFCVPKDALCRTARIFLWSYDTVISFSYRY
ncbi:Small integral membrane protein 14 [Fasciolopsis buskii]|uniref:Small integral membrane protein 14 n=1 Tax=Fasciolopsis buskii TaxID=27845 RepID=A0A8E0RVI5_9TREM|nr:Small integral membrane protein 14 [Fasciolopsis buski]